MAHITLLSYVKIFISIAVVLCAIMFRTELKMFYENFMNYPNEEKLEQEGIFTATQLAQYDGISHNKLYLAVLGVVFDVSKGRRHYEKGAGYHYFVGKDGSRALVTGDFADESNHKDQVMDLSCTEFSALLHWRDTFQSKYEKVGVLIGRFYNKNGEPTPYSAEFDTKVAQCEVEKALSREEEVKYPPCNVAWSAEVGSKVWCTKSSGGVMRSWTGVPRQLYTPGVERPRCVCVNTDKQENSLGLFKEYDKCPNTSTECMVDV